MAHPPSSRTKPPRRPDFLINEEADRELNKIMTRYFVLFVVLMLIVPVGMSFVNYPRSPYFRYHKALDAASVLIFLIPFFVGTNRMFAARLRLGRRFVDEKRWKEAAASLEAFSHFGQRFLDPTGEAHYLLSLSLAHLSRPGDAQRVREFVVKRRPSSRWAARINEAELAKARPGKVQARREEAARPEEIRRKVSKGRRRRF